MKIIIHAVALLLIGFTALSVDAASQKTDLDLLNKIQQVYGQLQTFEADFTQTLTHRESGAVEKRKGKLLFQRPLNIRWQTQKPHEETLVVNQKEIWDYLPDEEIAYRYAPELAQDSRSIIQVLTGQAKLNKDFDVKNGGKDHGLMKLILFPKEPTSQMIEAAIWIDPASTVIQRANVTDFYGNVNDVAFNSFKPGAKIAASQFSFKAPKGVEVEDRIKRGLEERTLFK